MTGADFAKESGEVALLAQTGQLSECIIARAQGEGIRYSKSASYGNAVDINEADLIEYLMDDKETRIITQYLEGVRDGRRFFDIARRNSGKKTRPSTSCGRPSTWNYEIRFPLACQLYKKNTSAVMARPMDSRPLSMFMLAISISPKLTPS